MDIEIKALTPELTEDYLHFFDETPHDDKVDEHKCYCVCWCGADHRVQTDFSSREKRRELARQYIGSGALRGYLAYADGRVVGWCNANERAECLNCVSWLRFMKSVDVCGAGLRVKSVFCFVVAPEMQRRGIATKLLARVCEDAASDGFDFVEAYPNREFVSTSRDFMGPMEMYRKLGFAEVGAAGDMAVMRKKLR